MRFLDADAVAALGPAAAVEAITQALRGGLDPSVDPARMSVDLTNGQFLLMPSWLVLAAGGLAFGAALGTLLGGLGIVLSALLGFTLARTLGREWLRLRMGERLAQLERYSQRIGPVLVGLAVGVLRPGLTEIDPGEVRDVGATKHRASPFVAAERVARTGEIGPR